MKARWKWVAMLAAASTLCAFFLLRSDRSEQEALEEARRSLRQQGFKTDLSEFNFSTSEELRARAAALTNADLIASVRQGADYVRLSAFLQNKPDLMASVGSNSAIVVWRQDTLQSLPGEDTTSEALYYRLMLERYRVTPPGAAPSMPTAQGGEARDWPSLGETLNENRVELDAACEAALSGPIRFNLMASQGNGLLLPHLATIKRLAQTLGARTALDLHDGNRDAAWTNLLASTRLVSSWEPEPAEVSHLVRFGCATIAFNTTWQALQADGWGDDRLAQLQREWESADFLRALPETKAFQRASMVATCQLERQQPIGRPFTGASGIRSPQSVWYELNEYWRRLRYRQHGSYEDERALLLHYRDREQELRRAVKSESWSEMCQLPGITNFVLFQSKHRSSIQAMMNNRQLMLASQLYAQGGQGQGHGILGRAADAEARRRLLITAIALERYRARHGSYPETLQGLAPDLLKNPLRDFMDGKPLRYRRRDDGQFVLYSVGLDGKDNGGEMRRQPPGASRSARPGRSSGPQGTDLVWPRPASTADVEAFCREQAKALAEQVEQGELLQAEEQWRRTAKRQAEAEKLLAAKPKVRVTEPSYRGRPLSETLRNPATAGAGKLTLEDLLTLKQVTTGEEPETVTFEVPVSYDILTNFAGLRLYIDPTPTPDEDSDEGPQVGQLECKRAANGNCLLVWRTIYESPGQHALQMGLVLDNPNQPEEDILGPVAPFVVSNLCQFSLSSAYFNPSMGATLRAKLPELNATYTLDITSPAGDRLKTISGSTSNGILKVHWNLMDEHGRKCTNNAYGSFFHITLPDSGRFQKLNGP